MKKWLLILGCSLVLSGCTDSTIREPGGELSPDFETRAGIEIDWEQAFADMSSIYIDDQEAVNLGYFMNVEDDGSETIYITAIVEPGMMRTDAALLGTRMVKSLNDILADQDFNYAKAGESSYGGITGVYNIGVRIMAEDATDDPQKALVNDTIYIGETYRAMLPNK